jgi:hypothetical protein
VSFEAGVDVSVPTGIVTRTIDTGRALATTDSLTEEEKRTVLAAGFNLAMSPPSLVEHVGLTYAPGTGWEVGLRYTAHAGRLGARRQLRSQAHDGTGWDLTVGLGIQRFSFGVPFAGLIPLVQVNDFTRYNFDVPLIAGRRGDFYRVWGGPRLLWSRYRAELALRAPGQPGDMVNEDLASVEGQGAYIGLQGGTALGYKMVFLAFELTVVRFLGSARMHAFGSGTDIDTGTWLIYPGIALLSEW